MMNNTDDQLLSETVPQQEETVKLVVNPRQFNTIVAGLAELPYKVSNEVLQALVAQVQQQVKTAPQ